MNNNRAIDIIFIALDNLALDLMHDSDAHEVTLEELDELSMITIDVLS
jgi:hypothetical protein|tara:strand:- start:8819 stop:8962 length:144 start_codon:yes stop_codon:yes gene_type:complete